MLKYCSICQEEVDADLISRKEQYNVKGEVIEILVNVYICCNCNETIYDRELDTENLRCLYNEYRKRHDILGPDDFRRIRKKYGLSQRGLAILLGWSQTTVVRYEGNSIASLSHNEQIKRLDNDLQYFTELYNRNKTRLSTMEVKRISEFIRQMDTTCISRSMDSYFHSIINLYSNQSINARGGKDFDFDKLANMVVFFAHKINDLPKSKLMKLLFYSDFGFYKKESEPISGSVYCHNYYGPIPDKHYWLLSMLEEYGYIELVPISEFNEGDKIIPKTSFEEELFTNKEIEHMETVASKFAHCSTRDMTYISHNEDAYTQTSMKQIIDYRYAESLRGI